MRRLIALILLLIVPLQFSWSAAMGVHGHRGGETHAAGIQVDDHDLHANAHSAHGHDSAPAGQDDTGHNDDCQHVSHCHHVFSVVFATSGLTLGQSQPGTAPVHPAARFTSHTPLLPDPPPPARA